jgi:hypothetical protein
MEQNGNLQGALGAANGVMKKIDDLNAALQAKSGLFTDQGALGEMQARIARKKGAVAGYAAQLNQRIAAAAAQAAGQSAADDAAAQPQAAADAAKAGVEGRDGMAGIPPTLDPLEADLPPGRCSKSVLRNIFLRTSFGTGLVIIWFSPYYLALLAADRTLSAKFGLIS